MKFEVYGPFELVMTDKRSLRKQSANENFVKKTSTSEYTKGRFLSDACGCYVFAIGTKPWYVGKTEKRTFGTECLTPSNIDKFNVVLDRYRRGTPTLYLLPKITPKSCRFAVPTKIKKLKPGTPIDSLETMLIGMGIERNKDLANIGKTKMHGLEVAGFFKSKQRGPRGEDANKLRNVFGLKKK